MRNRKHILVLLILSLMIAACVAGPNPAEDAVKEDGKVAGFWQGLWHGIISPIAFIISLFSENVHFYEVHNNGGWYNFGFILGAGILTGGGSAASKRRRSWKWLSSTRISLVEATLPKEMFPRTMRVVSRMLPLTYVVDLLEGLSFDESLGPAPHRDRETAADVCAL